MKKFNKKASLAGVLILALALCFSGPVAQAAYNFGETDLVPQLKYIFNTAATFGGTLTSTGNFAVGSNTFTVAAASGNVVVGGTLLVTGAQTFTGALNADGGVDRSTAAALTLGPTNATSVNVVPDFKVNTTSFTVAASSGNTQVGGTFGSTGAATFSSTVSGPGAGFGVYTLRTRTSIASANSGVTLLPAVTGRKYRIIDAYIVAIGGNVTSTNVTHFEIRGTQSSSSAVLFKVAKAQLTQSAINRIGTASTLILADGASFVANDASTAITLNPLGGSDAATATNLDTVITYSIE